MSLLLKVVENRAKAKSSAYLKGFKNLLGSASGEFDPGAASSVLGSSARMFSLTSFLLVSRTMPALMRNSSTILAVEIVGWAINSGVLSPIIFPIFLIGSKLTAFTIFNIGFVIALGSVVSATVIIFLLTVRKLLLVSFSAR